MKKVLFAINHKQTEAALTERLQQFEIIPTGAVTYREAIAASLSESPADILVFRENLKGSTNVFELMKELRINYSRISSWGNWPVWASMISLQVTAFRCRIWWILLLIPGTSPMWQNISRSRLWMTCFPTRRHPPLRLLWRRSRKRAYLQV